MKFLDRATIDGTRIRADGSLIVDARTARTGIQKYAGFEVGRPEKAVVYVYRPENEVFSDKTMQSFGHKPVTNDHPDEMVTADNWKKVAVGQTDGEIKRDGEFIRVPLMVSDGATIEDVKNGKRELSAGYTCDLEWTSGTTESGQIFDAIQRNIRANHVAIVDRGRAGPECRIGDADKWGSAPIVDAQTKEPSMATRTVLIDGLPIETTDNGAHALEKLLNDRKAAQDAAKALEAEHAKAMAAKDAELAKAQAALDDAKAKVLDQAQIDKLVADRAALEAVAKSIAPEIAPKGLSDAALKAAVVKAKIGDAATGKSEAYIDARFDILAETAAKPADNFKDSMANKQQQNLGDAEAMHKAAFDNLVKYDATGKDAQ